MGQTMKRDEQPSTVVVASATAGSGCSVALAVLATVLARRGTAVVLDLAAPTLSPWPRAVTTRATNGFTVDPPTVDMLASMTSRRVQLAPAGNAFDVLTDLSAATRHQARDWAWWRAARAAGGWTTALVDLATPLLLNELEHELWAKRTNAVLVLVVPATRPGTTAATRLITGWEADSTRCQRTVMATVSRAPGRCDGRVLAELTMLDRRVAARVQLPFDIELHRRGLGGIDRMHPRTARAHARLADAALDVACRTATPPTAHRLPEVS